MNRIREIFVILLAVLFLSGALCPAVWAQDNPITDEYNMLDLFVARPIGVAAGIVGTALFVVSLPFTLPTGSVDRAKEMFISKPFSFSFKREFPDPNVRSDGYNDY